jgi:NADPH:quinone reductase-like Zn-dependent oxidoreductase
VQLCKDLGADIIVDYRTADVYSELSTSGPYDMVLDNVGAPTDLYWKSPGFTKPGAKYVQVGSEVSLGFVYDVAFRFLLPTWLGGGQRPFLFGLTSTSFEDLSKLGQLVAEKSVVPVIDETFGFNNVPQAYNKLKTGRARGKIVVRVASVD